MSESPELRTPRKRKRWPLVVAILLALVMVGWLLLEYTVDVDSYRPMLIDRITKYTGLPATIERIDLALLPFPNVRAEGVSVGEGDFKAVCARLSAQARISSLLRGVVDVSELTIEDLVVVLPKTPGELKDRVNAMTASYDEAKARKDDERQGSGRVSFAIGYIDAPSATITLKDAEKPVLQGALAATDVLSKIITISADAASPAYGDDARIEGTVTLNRNGVESVGLGVTGEVDLTSIDTSTLFNVKRVPDAVATAHATIERTAPHEFRFDVDGNAEPVQTGGVDLNAIAGTFTGVGWWQSGEITLNDLTWNAPGVDLTADITVHPDGAIATHVGEIAANNEGVEALLSAQPSEEYRLTATGEAEIRASDLVIGVTAEKELRLAGGTATFSGVNLSLPEGADAITGVKGELAFDENAIHITSLDASGLSLTGTVSPDLENAAAEIDLAGQFDLTRERLAMVMPIDMIKEAQGTVTIKKVTGTFNGEGGVPENFSITGKLSDAHFEIASEAWTDTFRGVGAEFKATPGAIETTAEGVSKNLGDVTVQGKYAIAEKNWNGSASANLGEMDLPFLKQDAAKKVAPGILDAYGDSTFKLALALPTEKRKRLNIAFSRAGSPKLEGDVALLTGDAGWALGGVNLNATLPGDALDPILPSALRVRGMVPVEFSRSTDPAVFQANIDLRGNVVELSDYFTKREGVSAGLRIDGSAAPGKWAAKTVAITCLDQTINGRFTEERFEVPAFDISAGALAALMPEGARAGGRIRGSFATQPTTANVALEQVNFALNEELGMEHLNGGVSYTGGIIRTENLEVRGANSDFTIDLVSRDSGWSGALTGKQLDVNAMLNMKTALDTQAPSGVSGGTAAAKPEAGFKGTFDVNMETVLVKNAVFNNVFTNANAEGGNLELANLTFTNREGSGSGWVRLGDTTAMNLKVDGVDQGLIDDLIFDEPRGLKGPMTGTIELDIPSGDGSSPLLSGTNGIVRLSSIEGTFGKLGMATKVLSALRTLEITRLRAPKLKDQGLAYDTCEVEAKFVDGIMDLSTFDLKTASYVITALGAIDFNQQDSNVLVHVDILESVLGPTNLIPGLGEVVGMFRNTGGFRITLKGNPVDPEMSYGFGPKPGSVTDDIKNKITGDGNQHREEILGRATDALKGLLEKE